MFTYAVVALTLKKRYRPRLLSSHMDEFGAWTSFRAAPPPSILARVDDGSLYDRVIAAVERPLIEVMLARHAGNQLRAARAMGINRNTLRKRLDALGIDAEHWSRP